MEVSFCSYWNPCDKSFSSYEFKRLKCCSKATTVFLTVLGCGLFSFPIYRLCLKNFSPLAPPRAQVVVQVQQQEQNRSAVPSQAGVTPQVNAQKKGSGSLPPEDRTQRLLHHYSDGDMFKARTPRQMHKSKSQPRQNPGEVNRKKKLSKNKSFSFKHPVRPQTSLGFEPDSSKRPRKFSHPQIIGDDIKNGEARQKIAKAAKQSSAFTEVPLGLIQEPSPMIAFPQPPLTITIEQTEHPSKTLRFIPSPPLSATSNTPSIGKSPAMVDAEKSFIASPTLIVSTNKSNSVSPLSSPYDP
jgi:hypothetical protein